MRFDISFRNILPTLFGIAGASEAAILFRTASIDDICLMKRDVTSGNSRERFGYIHDNFISECVVHNKSIIYPDLCGPFLIKPLTEPRGKHKRSPTRRKVIERIRRVINNGKSAVAAN